MNAYSRARIEDRRYLILRFAAEGNGAANSAMLADFLDDMGHKASADQIRSDLGWLSEQGLVAASEPDRGGIVPFSVTERGADVARGRASVPGVRHARPHEA